MCNVYDKHTEYTDRETKQVLVSCLFVQDFICINKVFDFAVAKYNFKKYRPTKDGFVMENLLFSLGN